MTLGLKMLRKITDMHISSNWIDTVRFSKETVNINLNFNQLQVDQQEEMIRVVI